MTKDSILCKYTDPRTEPDELFATNHMYETCYLLLNVEVSEVRLEEDACLSEDAQAHAHLLTVFQKQMDRC